MGEIRSRNWCFIIEGFTYEDEVRVANLRLKCESSYSNKDQGKLYGYLTFNGGIYLSTIKKALPNALIEKSKGDLYTSYYFKDKSLLEEYKDVKWNEWQTNLSESLDKDPFGAKINLFVNSNNDEKDFLIKYLALSKIVVISNFFKIFTSVVRAVKVHEVIDIIICDAKEVCLDDIELIKRGLIYSNTVLQCSFKITHVIVVVVSSS